MTIVILLVFTTPSKGLIFDITLGMYGLYTFVFYNEKFLSTILEGMRSNNSCEIETKLEVNLSSMFQFFRQSDDIISFKKIL